jgi:GNAT superfamily N-acetyltransferase
MENDDMVFDMDTLKSYVETSGAYGFVYRAEEKAVGFAYGCRLPRPDGQTEMYLHSIDILPGYQGRGYGSKFFKAILDFAKAHDFCQLFLNSSQSLQNARHIYEKFGGVRECEDEIIFSYPLLRKI